MRTATPETRKALRAALAGYASQREMERVYGWPHGTIADCLRKRPMKAKRENMIRTDLGLPPIAWERVEYEPDKQKIVNRQKPRRYVTRQLRLPPGEATALDSFVKSQGYRSFNHYWKSVRPLEWPGAAVEFTPQQNDSENVPAYVEK